MRIAEIMSRNVKTCLQTDMLDHATKLMWDFDIGSVAVTDASGQLVGIVTDRDACMAAFMQRQPMHCIQVTVAMSKHVVTCRPDETTAEVARLMARNKVRRIPVIDDDDHPVGIVSINDLAVAMVRSREIPAQEIASTLAEICEHRPTAPVAPT